MSEGIVNEAYVDFNRHARKRFEAVIQAQIKQFEDETGLVVTGLEIRDPLMRLVVAEVQA